MEQRGFKGSIIHPSFEFRSWFSHRIDGESMDKPWTKDEQTMDKPTIKQERSSI
ncbi:hypothetical protein K4L44_16025 [Halosquirtibacter laminarini]|uniref:Uncharacterized protein n=1 Tax=Halosquirtibacter laminarini TaxID=3374600 RepID=A0AC61NNM0_9BACT|nr:hypothetical protein K4L44_16025 [Prolixibacteraceae bacterium]